MIQAQHLKVIQPGLCPHCEKEIYISYKMYYPQTYWVLKKETLDKAKQEVKERTKTVIFKNETEKNDFLKWLDSENTTIAPEDVENIVQEIIEKNQNNVSTDTKTDLYK